MKLFKSTGYRVSIVGELFGFLWERRLWWLIPMLTVVLAAGLMMVFAQSSPLAPLLYPLF